MPHYPSPVQPTAGFADPQLVQSSEGYGWPDLAVSTYTEPRWMERWEEPVASDVMLKLILRGEVRVETCDPRGCDGYHIRPGDLFLKPPGVTAPPLRWCAQSPEPAQSLHIYLSQPLFSRTIAELTERDPAHIELAGVAGIQDPLILQIGLALYREMAEPSSFNTLYAQTASVMLVAHLLRHYTMASLCIPERTQGLNAQQISRIRDYVLAHLAQPLTLETLAEQIGFSPYHFARLFRLALGESPHQFVLRQRIEQAQHLLRHTDMPISQVALESGFAHQSHLTQAFKRSVGITPRAFRLRL